MIIPRFITPHVKERLKYYPILSLTGPRQSGKTTLLRFLFPDYEYVSLENFKNQEHAQEDPIDFLEKYSSKTIFDEAQRVPQLFSYLQTKVDLNKQYGQYILSGSQNFLMRKNITQSLAGRVGILRLLPFTLRELMTLNLGYESLEENIFRGFYPGLFDAQIPPTVFYDSYIETYLHRDVQELVNPKNLTQFHNFLQLCAGHVGQLINLSKFSNNIGISLATVKNWLSILEQSYIIFQLAPYYKNFNKRIIKKSKLYFYDTGLVCNLLGMKQVDDVRNYYQKGALFENLVIAEIMKSDFHKGTRPDLYFWRDSHGNEMDLLRDAANLIKVLEVKSTKTLMSNHFNGINKFRNLFQHQETKFYLAQGGDEEMTRNNGTQVLSWRDLREF